ncbi:MAG: TolC family protein [Candidatus Omnitrophica bacterium]|nr:TolC family protein [Candidatus Omnitrophota bacterium]
MTRVIGGTLIVCLAAFVMIAENADAIPFFERQKKEPLPAITGPLTLKDCYALALRQSEEIAIRREEIEATEAEFFKAASEALGDVHFKMTQFRQDARDSGDTSSVGGSLTRQLRRERVFEINQPVFQGFKAFAAINAAGALRKQRSEERKRAEQLLFLDVAKAFYAVLLHKKDVEIIEEIEKLFQERIQELNDRESIGRSRRSEVVTAEARLKTLLAELARSRGNRIISRYELEFLTGAQLDAEQLMDEDLPLRDAGSLENYLANAEQRPDVKASRQALRTASQGIISAQSDLWPEITVDTTAYELREGFQSGIDWDVLLTIDVPLFQGGEIVGNIKEAITRKKKFQLSHDLTKREAELDIKKSFQTWLTAVNRYSTLKEAREASEENYDLQKEEYERNLVGNLDVLEALESLNQTRRDVNDALYRMKENYWGLKVSVGDIP